MECDINFKYHLLQLVVDAIQNMRTVKQLSIETEVLQQYSNLIYQSVLLVNQTINIYKY